MTANQDIRRLDRDVRALRSRVLRSVKQQLPVSVVARVRPEWREPMRNLVSYLALRNEDLAPLQDRLSRYGLSSLGRSEARVQLSLDALAETLGRLSGREPTAYPASGDIEDAGSDLDEAVNALFGPDPNGPVTRIMVTLPDDAGDHPGHLTHLLEAGADLFRVNCAHGDPMSWARAIAAVRAAEKSIGRHCRVLMDLGGPKIRIDAVERADTRLHVGSHFRLTSDSQRMAGFKVPSAFIAHPAILAAAVVGHAVWFDDGKLQAEIVSCEPDMLELVVRRARRKGVKLRAGKGLAFPDQTVDLPALTSKDLIDLDFVAHHADLVGFSFVQTRSDVEWLHRELAARRPGLPELPLVLKIETRAAVMNLPELIIAAASRSPTAVMIARGDLALGVGFADLSAMQEQILWLCEAASVPVIWATQVLESLVKEGIPTRSEATDAASSQRADCVMLNKGTHQVEAVAFLDQVLRRMDRHMAKKSPVMGALSLWATQPTQKASS